MTTNPPDAKPELANSGTSTPPSTRNVTEVATCDQPAAGTAPLPATKKGTIASDG